MFKLAEILLIDESVTDAELEPMYDDIHAIAIESMNYIESTEESAITLYKNKYLITIGYSKDFIADAPEDEFVTIVSLASEEEKKKHYKYSDTPTVLDVEVKE